MNKIAHLFLIALAIAILTMLAAIAWSQPIDIKKGANSIVRDSIVQIVTGVVKKDLKGGISIRGDRNQKGGDPPVEDLVTGSNSFQTPQFRILDIDTSGTVQEQIDTSSRVYKIYYKHSSH